MDRAKFKFEYGNNLKLKKLVESWKKHNEYRGYCIVGASGTGKTLLLKELREELQYTEYFSGDVLIDKIYRDIRNSRTIAIPVAKDSEVILIDYLDNLAGREAATREMKWMLKKDEYSNGVRRLIICTFINEYEAEIFAQLMGYKLIYLKHVKPNRRIIKQNANVQGIRLSKTQIDDFADFDTMLELRSAFNELI